MFYDNAFLIEKYIQYTVLQECLKVKASLY